MNQEAINTFIEMAKSYGYNDEKIAEMLKEGEAQRKEQEGRDIYYDYETLADFENVVSIKYDSPPAEPTERTVDVKKIILSSYGELCIGGFCRLRNDERIFRIDRIITAHIGEAEIDIKGVVFEKLKNTPGAIDKIANFKGLNFCFTGTLLSMRRKQAQEKIEALGGRVLGSLDERSHFLVTGEKKQSGSYKTEAAGEYGVPVITEEKFLEFLAHPEKAQAEKTAERKKKNFTPIASFSLAGITPLGPEYKEPEEPSKPQLTMKEKEELKIIKDVTFDISFTYRGYKDSAKILKFEKTYDGDFYLTGFSNRWEHDKRWHGQEMEAAIINGFEINAVQFFQGILDNTEEAYSILNNTAENLAKEALKE
jgi:hypothetical protein